MDFRVCNGGIYDKFLIILVRILKSYVLWVGVNDKWKLREIKDNGIDIKGI